MTAQPTRPSCLGFTLDRIECDWFPFVCFHKIRGIFVNPCSPGLAGLQRQRDDMRAEHVEGRFGFHMSTALITKGVSSGGFGAGAGRLFTLRQNLVHGQAGLSVSSCAAAGVMPISLRSW